MNREIKFRAWNPDDKRIEYPLVFAICSNDKLQPLIKCSDGNRAYKDYPIMQYTGLKDKNGKEIYEGDILRNETFLVNLETNQKVMNSDFVDYYEVFFNSETGYNSFALKCVKTTRKNNFGLADINKCFINNYTQKSEVIGNVFENPELLKE
jgi:uncharacterized phage protein (TIGR01671 family)